MWMRTALMAAVTVGALGAPAAGALVIAGGGNGHAFDALRVGADPGDLGCGDWHRMDYEEQRDVARRILDDIRDTPSTDAQRNALRTGLDDECEGDEHRYPNVPFGHTLGLAAVLVYGDDPRLLD